MFKYIFYFLIALKTLSVESNHDFVEARIVGGQNVDIRDFPHQVAIMFQGIPWCGGSVYSSNIIITAAHCVKPYRPSQLKVKAGLTLLSKSQKSYAVKKIIVHEKYDIDQFDFDIALIILKDPLTFSASIKPIALAQQLPPAGTKGTVTGWGHTKTHVFSDHLLMAQVKTLSEKDCNAAYPGVLTKSMFCAGVPDGSKDACQGDSGGPFTVDNKLVGVVSFGRECGSIDDPGVYASIPYYYNWIIDKAAKL